MTEWTAIIISTISGVFLGVLSNWLYDLLKNHSILPERPTLKRFVAITAAFVPFLILVALPAIINKNHTILSTQVFVNQQDVSNYPKWFQMVALNPIIPGYGAAAGIRLGDHRSKVIEILGPPTKDFHQIFLHGWDKTDKGYSAWWEYRSYRLVVRASSLNDRVTGIWISDYDLNSKKLIPSFDKISIGSSEAELRKVLGAPIAMHPVGQYFMEFRGLEFYYDDDGGVTGGAGAGFDLGDEIYEYPGFQLYMRERDNELYIEHILLGIIFEQF